MLDFLILDILWYTLQPGHVYTAPLYVIRALPGVQGHWIRGFEVSEVNTSINNYEAQFFFCLFSSWYSW